MSTLVRAFIAVEIPPEIRDLAKRLIARLQGTEANVRWVKPEHLHWTLKFLGEVDLREIPDIAAAVQRAIDSLEPFDIAPLGAGAFPTADAPRTVWMGLGAGTEDMVALHDAIDTALLPLGYRAEARRYRPHLTIGRVRQSSAGLPELADLIRQQADLAGGVSTVYEVAVVSSVLDRDGPTHEPLCHLTLGGE